MGKLYQNSVWAAAEGGVAQFDPKAYYDQTLKILLGSFFYSLSKQSSLDPESFSNLILP